MPSRKIAGISFLLLGLGLAVGLRHSFADGSVLRNSGEVLFIVAILVFAGVLCVVRPSRTLCEKIFDGVLKAPDLTVLHADFQPIKTNPLVLCVRFYEVAAVVLAALLLSQLDRLVGTGGWMELFSYLCIGSAAVGFAYFLEVACRFQRNWQLYVSYAVQNSVAREMTVSKKMGYVVRLQEAERTFDVRPGWRDSISLFKKVQKSDGCMVYVDEHAGEPVMFLWNEQRVWCHGMHTRAPQRGTG